jgi:hypothetical protein
MQPTDVMLARTLMAERRRQADQARLVHATRVRRRRPGPAAGLRRLAPRRGQS